MRSVIIISLGLILWALSLAASKFFGNENPLSKITTTLVFVGLWLILSGLNLYQGIQTGFSFQEELPIFLMIFLIPSLIAFGVQKKFS